MSFTITRNGGDITSYVIAYTTEQKICSGVGVLQLVLSLNYSSTINPYDIFVVTENGTQRGTYYAATIRKDIPASTITINAQDYTKLLTDNFIAEIYEITEPTTSRYWLELFMNNAGISYNFLSSDQGHYMSLNTSIGNQQLLEILRTLCVENGWYFLVDSGTTLNIGKLEVDFSTQFGTYHGDDILSIERTTDDKMLRNRVVIRGVGDPVLGIWITAEMQTITPWNYDTSDIRSTLIGSQNIPDLSAAYQLANQLFNETTKLTNVRTVQIAGLKGIRPGNVVYIESDFDSGRYLVTTVVTVASDRGEITTLILEERCPRLFGYYEGIGDVYIGTDGQGVYRKPIKYDDTWYAFNDGLGNRAVTDLAIYRGLYSCVADDYQFIRTPLLTSWTQQNPSFVDELGVAVTNVICNSTTMDRKNAYIVGVYAQDDVTSGWGFSPRLTIDNPRSFITITNAEGTVSTLPVVVSGDYRYWAYDADNDGDYTYLTVLKANDAGQIDHAPFFMPTTETINSMELPRISYDENLENLSDYDVYGYYDKYKFYMYLYGTGELHKRNLETSTTESWIDIFYSYVNSTSESTIGYAVIDDNSGLLVTKYSTYIRVYFVNWLTHAITLKAENSIAAKYTFFWALLSNGFAAIKYNDYTRCVFFGYDNTTGSYDVFMYNNETEALYSAHVPTTVNDTEPVYSNRIPLTVTYADLGNGTVGLAFTPRGSPYDAGYLGIVNTTDGSSVFAEINTDNSTTAYYSFFDDDNVWLAADLTDNSLICFTLYSEVSTSYAYLGRFLKLDQEGNLTEGEIIGSTSSDNVWPVGMANSQDTVVALYGNSKDNKYHLHNVTASGEIASWNYTDQPYMHVANAMDDLDNTAFLLRKDASYIVNSNLVASGVTFNTLTTNLEYDNAWSWADWDVTTPTVNFSTMYDPHWDVTYGPGIHITAKSTERGWSIGDYVTGVSMNSATNNPVDLNAILNDGQAYVAIATGKYNINTTVSPEYYATVSRLSFHGTPTTSDTEAKHGGWAYDRGEGTEINTYTGYASDYYATSYEWDMYYADLDGTPVDGIAAARMWFTPCTNSTSYLDVADYYAWRGDNSGTMTWDIYTANYPTMDLLVGIPVTAIVYPYETITITFKEHWLPLDIYSVFNPELYMRLYYTDDTYRDFTINRGNKYSGDSSAQKTATLTIPFADLEKVTSQVIVGYRLISPKSKWFDIDMIVTGITFSMANPLVLDKITTGGSSTILQCLGNFETYTYDPDFFRVIGRRAFINLYNRDLSFEFTSSYSAAGGSNSRILRYKAGIFDDVTNTSNLTKVEASRSWPIAAYGGYETLDGAQLYTNVNGDLEQMLYPSGKYIQDLRGVSILESSGLMSGFFTVESDGVHQINLTNFTENPDVTDFPITISGEETISGVTHIETNNYTQVPYIFVSVISGGTQTFYQSDGGELGTVYNFTERNTDLPTSTINTIRLDDRL